MRMGFMGGVLLLGLALAGPAAASITVPPGARVDLGGGRAALAGGDLTSRSTAALVCETGTSPLLGSTYWRALPNVPATTGVDLPARPLNHSFDDIP